MPCERTRAGRTRPTRSSQPRAGATIARPARYDVPLTYRSSMRQWTVAKPAIVASMRAFWPKYLRRPSIVPIE